MRCARMISTRRKRHFPMRSPTNQAIAVRLTTCVQFGCDATARSGERRALPRLEQLHREHPDYTFAAIALAQFAANNGEYQRARALLSPCYRAEQLHITEATALFSAQAQIALEEGDIDAAERAFDMLCDISDEDDPTVMAIRYHIDRASPKRGLHGLFAGTQETT